MEMSMQQGHTSGISELARVDSPQLKRLRSWRAHPPETIAYLSRGKTHYRLQGDPRGELVSTYPFLKFIEACGQKQF